MKEAKLLLGILLCGGLLLAQSTAQMNGTARDASGGAVPGRRDRATHMGTGSQRTVTTEANGAYFLTNLPIGSYTIEASKAWFQHSGSSLESSCRWIRIRPLILR